MASENETWEKKLHDPSATHMSLPLEFLKAITCDFSTEQELGRGGYGVVYKGTLPSGKIIAVKNLFGLHMLGDEKFRKEANSLMGIKHQNIVQFLGYCAESSFKLIDLQGSGNYVLAEIPKRLLCFEHVCNKSLDKYISDESCGLDWSTRYEIIRGICGGLHYLHEECHIVHLDLKPENILMDATMVPKIADFGLSRIFADKQSRDFTQNRPGTPGYMAPEYIIQGVISIKADIYSLGVIIIEILTGYRHYPLNEDNSPESTVTFFPHFKEKILELWRNRLLKSQIDTTLLEQVRVCIELGIQCIAFYPIKRPVTKHMIDRLDDVNITDRSIKTGVGSTSVVVQAREASATMKKGDMRSEISHSQEDSGGHYENLVEKLSILEDITNNFSSDHEIARSTSGVFYKLPLTRMGPEGSEDGADRDIDVAMTPERLQSVTIRTGGVIDAFSFSYFDQSGEQRTVGPWGAGGPINATTTTIMLGPSEVVKGILGTMGKVEHTETAPTVITSLRIVTNIQTYGPIGDPIYYGAKNNTPFSIVAPENKSIVGFFGRSSRYVNAIGAYTDEANKHHVPERILCHESVEPSCLELLLLEGTKNNFSSDHEIARSPSGVFYKLPLARMGPAGSEDGADRDIDAAMTPECLQSVTIRTGGVIDAFSFSYIDQSGKQRTVGPWGAGGPIQATTTTIVLGPSEFVKGILGTMGKIEHTDSAPTVITSLSIVTNIQTYGPIGDPIYYGAKNNTAFSIVAPENKSIVGFFGRSSRYVNAIGAYTDDANKHHVPERMLCHESFEPSRLELLLLEGAKNIFSIDHEIAKSPSGVFYKLPLARMGPAGSEDGADRDIDLAMAPERLQSVTIRTWGVIDAFSFSYFDQSGEQRTVGPWGAGGPIQATTTTIVLGPTEVVKGILGTMGKIEHTETAPTVITSLRIVSNIQTYGPIGNPIYYGAKNNTPFSIVAPENKSIVGFFGRSSRYVNALGAYTI